MNVIAFCELMGFESVGFLTITFPEHLTWKEAERRFNNYNRRVLSVHFRDRIKVLEFTRSGRPHFHLVVACAGNIREGFNFEHAAEVAQWNRHMRHLPQHKPKGSYGGNELLRSLWKTLRAAAPEYGIGRTELIPLKSCAEAVGHYVGGYFGKSMDGRLPEHKGARMVSYSRGFPRAYKGAFSHLHRGRPFRQRLALWAAQYGCFSLEEVASLFGSRWFYHHKDAINEMEIPSEQTQAQATQGESTRRAALSDPASRSATESHTRSSADGTNGGADRGAGDSGYQRGSRLFAPANVEAELAERETRERSLAHARRALAREPRAVNRRGQPPAGAHSIGDRQGGSATRQQMFPPERNTQLPAPEAQTVARRTDALSETLQIETPAAATVDTSTARRYSLQSSGERVYSKLRKRAEAPPVSVYQRPLPYDRTARV
jgi:hypothetical protein